MKKILLFLQIILLTTVLAMGQTPTDFTVNDCSGSSHHLFAELNAGKVIVISFVMPCGSCIGPTQSALNAVQGYASTNPGKVIFYLIDDQGNTNCADLSAWGSANGITGVPAFSSTSVTETPYGSGGMPKIVVLGGYNHKVFFTQNGGLNVSNFQTAINSALETSGIAESKQEKLQLRLFPNPSQGKGTITYELNSAQIVSIDIYNVLGEKVRSLAPEKQSAGKHETSMDFETLRNGIYFVKLNAGESSGIYKFSVSQ